MNPLIKALADAIAQLDDHMLTESLLPTGDLDTNLGFLADIREQKARLAAVENEVERLAARQMPAKTYSNDHLSAERNRSYATTWDVRRTAWSLIEPLCVDHTTGELRVDEKVAWELIDRLLGAAAVTYYRVGPLRAAGLDPDEFREREILRTTVRVTRSGAGGER